jgi:hypothetical protein
MKHLVYCALCEVRPWRHALPAGVEESQVLLVAPPRRVFEEGGLAAACSVVPDGCATPTVPRATAFAGVVGALHAVTAVLPFRYGNFLDSSDQVLDLLRVHREEFLQSLEEVRGCDEMGLRILLENRPEHSVRAEHAPYTAHKNPCRVGAVHPPSSSHTSPGLACAQPARVAPGLSAMALAAAGGTGREFLEGRRAHYAAEECDEALAARAAAEARGALEGLAVKCHAERSGAPASPLGRVLSLFFLVRRENVERFREAFGQLQQETLAKMLLTGPWPPYNFVPGTAAAGDSSCLDGRPPSRDFDSERD